MPGDVFKITFMAKGGGAENMSALKMMPPSAGAKGIEDFVVDTVSKAGPNPCPPTVVGVGIGGNFDTSALLAKKALLRKPVGSPHPDPVYADMEKRILERINKLGIGPMGLGGRTTVAGGAHRQPSLPHRLVPGGGQHQLPFAPHRRNTIFRRITMVEIRFHGRGGQGTVIASKILADAVSKEDKYVQAFPQFGVERRGAPVFAFIRIDDKPIYIRSKIIAPRPCHRRRPVADRCHRRDRRAEKRRLSS